MNKRVVSLVLALVMILTMVPMTAMAASASDFSDVEQGKWYYTWIDNVAKEGYYAGYADGTFRPNVAMTRAMFVMVLANMEEAELDNSVSAFKDVEAGKWYTGATKWASDNKIVAGYTDGTFKPDTIVTREQMATIMQNYINWRSAETGEIHETEGSTDKFADDAKISKYAKEAVANCREWGLVDGYTDGTFRPQNGSTRAEVAAVISKLAWMVMGGESSGRRPSNDEEVTMYTLTYDANGGTNAPEASEVEEGENFVVAGPGEMTFVKVEEGNSVEYVFRGWNTKADYTGEHYEPAMEIPAESDMTLYAVWEHPYDYIAQAVREAMETFHTNYLQYGNQTIEGVNVLKAEGFKADETYGNPATPKAARPLNTLITGEVNSDLAVALIEIASDYAYALAYEVKGNGDTIVEDAEAVANKVIDKINAKFDGLGSLPAVENFNKAYMNAVKNAAKKAAYNAGSSVWEAFYDENGVYYTGDVTVTIGNHSAVVSITDKGAKLNYTREEQIELVSNMIFDLAKDMYADLVNEQLYGGYTSEVSMTGTVDLLFSKNTGSIYEGHTEKFTYNYPVNVTVGLKSGVLENNALMAYKYDDAPYVKLIVTEDLQDLYEAELTKAMEAALKTDTAQEKIAPAVNAAVASVTGSDMVSMMKNALVQFGYPAADTYVTTAIGTWKSMNVGDDLTKLMESNVFEYLWNENEIAFENEPLYNLVKLVGNTAGEYAVTTIDNQRTDAITNAASNVTAIVNELLAQNGITPSTPGYQIAFDAAYPTAYNTYVQGVNDTAEDAKKDATPASLASMAAGLGFNLPDNFEDIENYVFALAADKMNAAAGVNNNYATSAKENLMKANVNETIIGKVDTAVADHEYGQYLGEVKSLKTVEDMAEVELNTLYALLKNDTFRAYVAKGGATGKGSVALDYVVKVINNLPDGCALEVAGAIIDESVIDDVKDA
ncbi:MAG: S-layer homology domain-containing protein, partial [Firmicutes bacterium]|nr:S-layer homology domain-containing protein [Bacillota bacterium]